MPARLRVAMVTLFPESPDRIVGGVAGVARYLAPALAALRAFDLTIVVPGALRDRVSEVDGIPVRFLEASRGPGFVTYWTLERRRIARELAQLRPDVVHFQGIAGWGLACPFPSVLTLHGIAERDALYSTAPLRAFRSRIIGITERMGRSRFAHVISISPYLEEEIGHQLRGRIWRIENPVDEAYFRVAREDDGRSILLLASIIERKNVLGAIDAFAGVLAFGVDARLRIGGSALDPAYRARCERLAEKRGVAARIDWLGSLSAERVREELARAACLLLPSFQETAPLVIEEAMAAGVPVVASALCGIPHLVSDDQTGFLVPPHDIASISSALSRLLGSAPLRARLGAAGREAADLRFRAERVARETAAVYEAAAGATAR